MLAIHRRWLCLLFVLVAARAPVEAADPHAFQEGRFGKGELRYVHHLPVLTVEGTPEDMGRQEAELTGTLAKALAEYPRQLMVRAGRTQQWDRCLEAARTLMSHASQADRDELRSFAERAGISLDLLTVGNTIMDIHRGGFACSSLMVDANKSQTGGILFGRNLDFYTLGVLDRYGLITVRRPKDKHAFATVGFPGLMGCLSGMNDAGLAIAVHEVPLSADGAPLLNLKAGPAGLVFRHVLEECKSIEEAEKLLHNSERATMLSLAICDRRHTGVLEITPKNVVLRTGSDGICVNTNHFRSATLCVWKICPRYSALSKAMAMDKLGVEDIFHKLDEVNQGQRTVQSMVFEPQSLILHVAMGKCPATKGSLEELDLAEFFRPAPHDSK